MDASSRARPCPVHYGAADHRMIRPLFLAGGTTALLWLAQARLIDPAMLPENVARYVTNGFCIAIACIFVGAGVYVWLQTLGINFDEADCRASVRRRGAIEGVLRRSLGRPLRIEASRRRCLAALDREEFE